MLLGRTVNEAPDYVQDSAICRLTGNRVSPTPFGLSGRDSFASRCKRIQKICRWRRHPPAAGSPGSSPGQALRFSVRAAVAQLTPLALRSDTRSLVSARPCDARCLRGSNVKTTGVRLVVQIAQAGARHSLVFPRPTHSPNSDAVDAAEKRRIKRI